MDPRSKYRWNRQAGRYVDNRGRFVAMREVRHALDFALEESGRHMQSIAELLASGEMTIAQWEAAMRVAIKDVQLYSAALAKGGWAQMTPADYGRVGQAVRAQYEYLAKFAIQIEEGLPFDGRFLQRVMAYAQGGRRLYHLIERDEMELRGLTQERSILHEADHCDDCVAEAEAGWQPIGEMVPIGDRQCLSKCKCTVEYQ